MAEHVTIEGAHVDYDTGPVLSGRAWHQWPALLLSVDPRKARG